MMHVKFCFIAGIAGLWLLSPANPPSALADPSLILELQDKARGQDRAHKSEKARDANASPKETANKRRNQANEEKTLRHEERIQKLIKERDRKMDKARADYERDLARAAREENAEVRARKQEQAQQKLEQRLSVINKKYEDNVAKLEDDNR